MAGDRHAAAGAGPDRFYSTARRISWRAMRCLPTPAVVHPDRDGRFGDQRQLRGAVPGDVPRRMPAAPTTNAMRQAFQLVAMIISIALTPIVTKAIGYQMTAIVYGILGGVVILYMALTSKETYVQTDEEKAQACGAA